MTDSDYLLIEKKIANELTVTEEQAFELKIAQDPVFAQEYAMQKTAVESLRSHFQEEAIRQELKGMFEQVKIQKRQQRKYFYYSIAATILLLFIAFSFYRYQQNSPESLYATYYTVYAVPLVRGEVDTSNQQAQAIILYNQSQYQTAISLLKKLEQEAGPSDWFVLLLGNSYLQTDQPDRAIRQFTQGLSLKDAILRQHAAWYLALSYLKKGEKEPAKKQLHEIIRQQGIYQEKAEELLSEL